tara:strand:+ start:1264 stop:2766 length:1503 start_codon:yes stop_codon:yes gene_type:complete
LLENIEGSIKRIINFVDTNVYSETYGLADRDFWSWRTKDFNNGSFQSLIYSLSCVKYEPVFKDLYEKYNTDNKVDQALEAYRYGCFKELSKFSSSQESFPHEKSFCVTSTLLYDLISALVITKEIKTLRPKEKEVLRDTAIFISKNIENHADIGNHLLGSLSALSVYCKHVDSSSKIIHSGMSNIAKKLRNLWSPEGWIQEYGGADIGYLTLSLHYLSDISQDFLEEKNDWIEKIMIFTSYFFHLDGSIGNIYGSRGSSIIYPSGFFSEGYLDVNEFIVCSIKNKKIPLQSDLDDTNFAPFINSLIRSCLSLENQSSKNMTLPITKEKYLKIFPEAGLVVLKNKGKQTVIDLNKSGIDAVFTNKSSKRSSLPAISPSNRSDIFCAFNSSFKVVEEGEIINISINSKFYKVNTKPISSLSILGSRLLIPIFVSFPWILKQLKKFIVSVYFLPGKSVGNYTKSVIIENFTLVSDQSYDIPKDFIFIEEYKHHPIRMASQNYW